LGGRFKNNLKKEVNSQIRKKKVKMRLKAVAKVQYIEVALQN